MFHPSQDKIAASWSIALAKLQADQDSANLTAEGKVSSRGFFSGRVLEASAARRDSLSGHASSLHGGVELHEKRRKGMGYEWKHAVSLSLANGSAL